MAAGSRINHWIDLILYPLSVNDRDMISGLTGTGTGTGMKKCDLTGTGTGTEIINLPGPGPGPGPGPIISILPGPGPGPTIQFYRDDRDDRDQNWYSHIESCNFHLHYNRTI